MGLFANVCIPFEGMSTDGLIAFVKEREKTPGLAKWALYVKRGPKAKVTLRDGIHASFERFVFTRPVPPYKGFLFLRRTMEIEDPREVILCAEVDKMGTHNIAARLPGSDDVKRAIHLVVDME